MFELSSWEMYYAPKILAAEQTCYWEGHAMNETSEWFLRVYGSVYPGEQNHWRRVFPLLDSFIYSSSYSFIEKNVFEFVF